MSLDRFTNDDIEGVIQFYRDYCQDGIAELVQKYPSEKSSLWVDVDDDLYRYNQDLAYDVKNNPDTMQELFEEALTQYDGNHGIDFSTVRVRFHNITTRSKKVDEIRNDDVDSLVSLNGQISKASAIRPVVKEAAWECSRCGSFTRMPIENKLDKPHECQGCERQGPFELDYHESVVRDHQLIRVKQPPEEATNSTQDGGDIDAHVEGDLVGYADAGERADVAGVLRADTGDEKTPTLDFYFDAYAVNKVDDDYRDLDIEDHRERIQSVVSDNPFVTLANSIAPGITGGRDVSIETPWGETYDKYWWVRLASGIANLFGSWRRPNGDGTHQRGDSHVILIGDPSTGKSTIMDAIAKIAPRSASESGKNASGAGLTAAAVNDDFGDSNWSLEAGALVKAHNGVACIDEIDKMDNQDLDRLHSALERQRLEFNKAGIDATLKCETSMLASGNPEGSRFNTYDSDQAQIDIVESLLDRFDLVFTFKDKPDEEKDRDIARSTITQRAESGLIAKNEMEQEERSAAKPELSPEEMRAWVAHSRKNVRPVIKSEEVMERLEDYYVQIRQENADGGDSSDESDEPVPATVRTLDGVLRLAEACARMRLSETVDMIDAEMAIALVKVSLEDVGYDPETGKMDADWANGRQSWTQQDRVNKLKGLIDTLDTGDTGADKQEVVGMAVEAGIEEDKALSEWENLREAGHIYNNDGWRVA
jgi:replicative DNA helicase Mcm